MSYSNRSVYILPDELLPKRYNNDRIPTSTSVTPVPPIRIKKAEDRERRRSNDEKDHNDKTEILGKKPNICKRFMEKCAKKCACCSKKDGDEEMSEKMDKVKDEKAEETEKKKSILSKLNCFKKKPMEDSIETDIKKIDTKPNTVEYENEMPPKRSLRDILCPCGRRKVGDSSKVCCGSDSRVIDERRDSILSQEPPAGCLGKMGGWASKIFKKKPPAEPSSRRTSLFSKNKSLSPTLPPEDTRPKLDPSLVEHTSVMRGAIPVLPISLAYFCLVCNVIVPGLGTVFSGVLCLCFGIPRFGIHDGYKPRIGAFIINVIVGCSQLFTVLFCLVGWGWSIWWGVIMLKLSRKYRKIRESVMDEENPPVTANNHNSRT